MARKDSRLVAFRQELPYRELWPIARMLARREPGVALLDSSCAPQDEGRWSVLGWRPKRTLRWPVEQAGALRALEHVLDTRRMEPDPDSDSPFRGGFLGWIGYDVGRHIERLPARQPVDGQVPVIALGEYESLLVEDRLERRLFLSGACDPREGPSRLIARQSEVLDLPAHEPADAPPAAAAAPRPDVSRDDYLRRVERVLAYIRAGDIFQANLAQRFTARLAGTPIDLYARLRETSPAPYGCFMDLGGPALLSISPELFLRRAGERVLTRPIKGTRPRSHDPAEDERLRCDLRDSEKDRAELAMIVDLLRNDLGRVARTGTVVVEEARGLHAHPTVHHAVATVAADVPATVGASELIRATMPGGSVTGAPKIRAMEILEELEDVRRGPYCGAAGWFGYDGDLALNILIRTLVVQDDAVSFHVGGAIVADSDPVAEYEETLDKARALLRALDPAGEGA